MNSEYVKKHLIFQLYEARELPRFRDKLKQMRGKKCNSAKQYFNVTYVIAEGLYLYSITASTPCMCRCTDECTPHEKRWSFPR